MSRLPRYFIPDTPFHVILRGNNREPIYVNDEDCQFFRDVLLDAVKRQGVSVHAYVFMTNHIHLLASPSHADSLPKALQSLGRRYVQYFNYRYQRTGTLWEGRYRATVVDAEPYLLECMRYIELNPVRAGMVKHPADFNWSSFRANAQGAQDALVTHHELYLRMGRDADERHHVYGDLFKSSAAPETLSRIRDCTNKGWALGGDGFGSKVEALANRRVAPLPKGRPKKLGQPSEQKTQQTDMSSLTPYKEKR